MPIDRPELKARTKEALRAAKPSPVWVTLAFLAVLLVLSALSMRISGQWDAYSQMFDEALQTGSATPVEAKGTSGFGTVIAYALEFMSILLTVGYLLYCLRISRRVKASFGDLFDVFSMLLRSLLTYLLKSLVIGAWGMLYTLPVTYLYLTNGSGAWALVCLPLLAPAAVAFYNYRLALPLMLDNPGMNCLQCLSGSRALMRGWRRELFKLDLSFLGWFFLSLIPLVCLWTLPYYQVAFCGFYNLRMQDRAAHDPSAPGAPGTPPQP